MELFDLLGIGGTGLAIAAAVLALFWKAEEAFSEEFTKALSQWLQGFRLDTPPPKWPDAFISMFDRLFGKKHLSWRCFSRSCVASIIAVAVFFVIFVNINESVVLTPLSPNAPIAIMFIFALALCFNIFPDYASLLETRLLMRIIARQKSSLAVILFLLADLLITVAIFVLFGTLLVYLMLVVLDQFFVATHVIEDATKAPTTYENPALIQIYLNVIDAIWSKGLSLSPDQGAVGIYFYSTFLTSIWVWLCALGWGAFRLAARIGPVLKFLQWALPIRTHPMRAIGEVAAVFTCLGYWSVDLVAGLI